MKIGVPREIKADEHRVAITPAGVRELVERGHDVLVEAGAGAGSAIADRDFAAQGARTVPRAADVWGEADLVLKVKEPQPRETGLLRPDVTLFTYLHLAATPELARSLCGSGATCVAYETIEDARGQLPLLAPMSEIAGKLAAHAGAFMLQKPAGGRGVLLGGGPGVPPAKVMVIGGGAVGMHAARLAIGMGATVYVYDVSLSRLHELDRAFGSRASTRFSSALAIEECLPEVDLVVGGVLVPGARAPHVIRRMHLELLKPGALLVDVAIDQGGCFETSRPTTHAAPTFEIDGITHYCVTNMPGAVPITSTYALTNATIHYVVELADHGVARAVARHHGLKRGVNVAAGCITHPVVAADTGLDYTELEAALGLGT